MIGLGVVSIVSIFTGMTNQFGEIFDILSYQQYLRYINLEYPQNLEMYFSINDLLSFNPILNFLNFDTYLNKISYEIQYSDSCGKFQQYGLNSDFQTNIQGQLVQVLFILSMIPLFKNAKRIKINYIFNSRFFYFMSSLSLSISSKIIFFFPKKVNSIFNQLDKMKQFVCIQGIKQMLYLNSWDLIFKIFLYLFSVESSELKHIVSKGVGITILLLYLQISIQDLHQMKSLELPQKLIIKVRKQNKLQSLKLIRQMVFLFILVYFQGDPKAQTILISLLSVIWLCITIMQGANKRSQFVFAIVEGSVGVFTFSSLIFVKDFTHLTTYELKTLIGWVQISLLSSGMIAQLIVTIKQQLNELICRKKQQNSNESFNSDVPIMY